MERNLPGVHFIDTLDENQSSENGVAASNLSAPSMTTTPSTTSIFHSPVPHSALSTNPIISIVTPRTENAEPQQILRQPLSSIGPDISVIRRPKAENFTSEHSMATAASPAGQSLIDFLDKLDNYKTTIPESIVQYYMQTAGLANTDPRVTQLIALAGQKFISDVVNDAFHFSQTQKCKKSSEKKPTLTMDVLTPVLAEYGITVKKPAYLQ